MYSNLYYFWKHNHCVVIFFPQKPRARGGSHPRDNAGRGGADVQTMALAHPAPLPAFPSPGGREGAPGRPARLRATHPGRGRD